MVGINTLVILLVELDSITGVHRVARFGNELACNEDIDFDFHE